MTCSRVEAQEAWNNSGAGDWFNTANWNPQSIPGTVATTTIDNGGRAQVGTTGAVSENLLVGNAASGSLLIQNGGALNISDTTTDEIYVGNQSGSTGSITIDGTGSTLSFKGGNEGISGHYNFSPNIGYSGNGALTIQNGGLFSVTNSDIYVGYNAGSNGVITVNGAGSELAADSGNILNLASSGTATLVVENGGTVTGGSASMGSFATATITGAQSAWTLAGNLGVQGLLSISSQASVSTASIMTSKNGNVVVDGAGSKLTGGAANLSTGTITVQNGAAMTVTSASVGGTIIVNGTGSSLQNSAGISLGQSISEPGSLVVENGGSVSNTSAVVGQYYTGSALVTGAGSTWSTAYLLVGDASGYTSATSSMTISTGGAVTSTVGEIGVTTPGAVLVSGSGASWTITGDLSLSYNGSAAMTIQNGGSVSDVNGNMNWGGEGAQVVVTGTNSNWTNSANLYVGQSQNFTGTVSLSITNGGKVSDVNGYVNYEGGTSNATVDGAGSKWVNSGSLALGYGGYSAFGPIDTSTLTISNGGEIDVNGGGATGSGTITVGTSSPGGKGNYTLQIGNGGAAGTLKAAVVSFGPNSTDSLVFDHNSTNYTFSSAIKGPGLILGQGTGTTILSGSSSAFTGTTTVSSGALLVSGTLGSSASRFNINGGAAGGSGTIGGALQLNLGGTLAPGGDGGNSHLTVNSMTWNTGGVMEFNLGTSSALLTVSGAFTKGTAGTFDFDLENGGGLADGTYDLVNFGSTTFSLGDFSYSSSLAGLSGHFLIQGIELEFDVTNVPLPVPEPGTWALLIFGLAGVAALRRARSTSVVSKG